MSGTSEKYQQNKLPVRGEVQRMLFFICEHDVPWPASIVNHISTEHRGPDDWSSSWVCRMLHNTSLSILAPVHNTYYSGIPHCQGLLSCWIARIL